MLGPQLSKLYKLILVWCIFNKKKLILIFWRKKVTPLLIFSQWKKSYSKLFSGINYIYLQSNFQYFFCRIS